MRKRVLICTFSMGIGGMETFLTNLVTHVDKNRFEIVLAINSVPSNTANINLIKKQGIDIFYLGNMRPNVLKYISNLKSLFENERTFDVIHTNLEYQGSLVLKIAKKKGVRFRIAHSHTTNVSTFYNRLLMPFYRLLFHRNANLFLACGEDAGKYMFGNNSKFEVIRNGIDISAFSSKNHKKNKELKIGQIGRLSKEKNQEFSIRLIKRLHEMGYLYNLYFIGEGDDEEKLRKIVMDYGISDYVHFIGMKKNIAEWYSKFDFLILPSLYEGVPFALLEAQCTGSFTFCSKNVSKESDLGLGLIKFLPLEEEEWAKKIIKHKLQFINTESITRNFKENGYDLDLIVKRIEKLYEK